MFSCEFYKISKNTFFTEHLWATASDICSGDIKCNVDQFQSMKSYIENSSL